MIQNRQCRGLALDASNVANERNWDKIYNHGLRAVGITRLPHERYVDMSGIGGTNKKCLVRACLHDEAAEPQCQKKSRMLCISCHTVLIIVSLWC